MGDSLADVGALVLQPLGVELGHVDHGLLEPLAQREDQVGGLDVEGGQHRVLADDEVHLGEDVVPALGVAEHRELVARHIEPHARLEGLAGGDGLAHRGDVGVAPSVETLVVLHAQTILEQLVEGLLGVGHSLAQSLDALLVLSVGHTDDGAHAVHVGEHAAKAVVVGDRASVDGLTGVGHGGEVAAALLRHGDAGLVDAAHDGVQAHAAQGHLGGRLAHVRSNAVGNAAPVLGVHLDGLLVEVGGNPGDFLGVLEGPGLSLILVDLAGGLVRLALVLALPEDLGIDGGVGRSAVLEGSNGAGLEVVAHVRRGVLGRGLLEVGEKLLSLDGKLGVGVDQEGQVRPVLGELFVVELVLEDVAVPGQEHARVGLGANGEPHVGLDGVGREVRVDDDGLDAASAQLGHTAAGLSGLGDGGLGAPDHDELGLVVLLVAEDLLDGVVCDGLVVAAVEELRQGPTGQVALGAARLEDGGRAERHRKRHGLHERVGTAAADGGEEGVVAVLVDGILDLGGRKLDSLVPGDDLEVGRAALADALQRVQDTTRAVHGMQLVEALDAQRALRHGGAVVALELGDHAVLDGGDSRAHLDAAVTRGVDLLDVVSLVSVCRRRLDERTAHLGADGHRRAGKRCCLDKAAACDVGVCCHAFLPLPCFYVRIRKSA